MASAIRIGSEQTSYDKRRTSVEGEEREGYIHQRGNAHSGGTGNNHHTDCEMRAKLTDEDRRKRRAEYARKYYQENKEKVLECHRKYRQENKEKVLECHRKYKQENKEKAAENCRENRQRIREEKRFAATLQMMSAVGQITELQTT